MVSRILESIQINLDKPILVLVDDQPAVTLANDGNNLKKSKHFLIKTEFIKQERQRGNFNIQHVKGTNNHSDIFTKALIGHLLTFHKSGILGHFLLQDILNEFVDCIAAIQKDDNPQIKSEFSIQGYPTIYYINGRVQQDEYEGPREFNAMLDWVKSKKLKKRN